MLCFGEGVAAKERGISRRHIESVVAQVDGAKRALETALEAVLRERDAVDGPFSQRVMRSDLGIQ
jgi:hypothetical protein